ncbi:hypothetical protein GTY56_13600 [Streptomyces sp. SID5643]|nr:hypothetical protein [Streptomyces sp. SID5643]
MRGHSRWQGGEDPLGADGVREAVRGQVVQQQVLFDSGEGEDDAALGEFATERVDGVQGDDVDLGIALGVEE